MFVVDERGGMKIETQFDLGGKVWAIYAGQKEYTAPCTFCASKGHLFGADGTRSGCPKCYGKGGKRAWHKQAWHVERELTIGQVRVSVTDSRGIEGEEVFDNFKAQSGREDDYMCVETGIGTGSVWKAGVLFATRDEAQAACDERNAQQVTT